MLSCAHFLHCLLLSFYSPLGKRIVTRPVTKKEKRKSILFILRVHEMNPVISTHQGQIWCQSVWVGINAVNKCDTSATLSHCISPVALPHFSQHGYTLDRVCFTSRVTTDVFASSGVGETLCRVSSESALTMNQLGIWGYFGRVALNALSCFCWPSAHQSLKKASILHCKPLIHRVYIYMTV